MSARRYRAASQRQPDKSNVRVIACRDGRNVSRKETPRVGPASAVVGDVGGLLNGVRVAGPRGMSPRAFGGRSVFIGPPTCARAIPPAPQQAAAMTKAA